MVFINPKTIHMRIDDLKNWTQPQKHWVLVLKIFPGLETNESSIL
jgi:hypothetical protein